MSYYVALPNGTYVEVPDDASADLVQGVRDKIAQQFPDLAPKQSAFRQVADVPIQVARGVLGSAQSISDAFGANNAVSQGLGSAEDYISGFLSAKSQGNAAEMARIMSEAKDKGIGDQLIAAGKAFATAPVDLIAQGIGSFAAPAGVGILSKAAKLGAVASGVASGATGAAMQAGAVKSAIYDETKKVLTEQGKLSPEDIEAAAQQAQAYNGKNLDQILIGAGLGAADALTGVDKIFRGVRSTEEVGRGITLRAAKGFASEAPLEALQGGQEGYAANVAVQRGGQDPNRDPFQGVAGKAALEGTIGGFTGSMVDVALGKRPGAPAQEGAPGTTQEGTPDGGPPTMVNPADDEPSAKIRAENAPTLIDLGYEPTVIASMPIADIQKVIAGGIMPTEYAPTEAPPVAAAEAPVVAPPVAAAEAPVVAPPVAAPAAAPVVAPPVAAAEAPVVAPPVAAPAAAPVVAPPVTAAQPKPVAPKSPAAPSGWASAGTSTTASPVVPPVFLPKPLAGAKPKYGYGTAQFTPSFQNDVDKALYITSQAKKSASDQKYRNWLASIGFKPLEIDGFGQELRSHMRDTAKNLVNSGVTTGSFPVNYMQDKAGLQYQNILSRKVSGVKSPVGAANAPTPTILPSQISPVSGLKQKKSTLDIDSASANRLESHLPGVVNIIREIQQRLYPGTTIKLKIGPLSGGSLGRLESHWGTPRVTLSLNVDAMAKGGDPALFQQSLLQTLFHELSHPLQYTWLARADDATFKAVVDQYVKERNPSAVTRSVLNHFFQFGKDNDPAFREKMLKSWDLTEAQYQDFLAEQSRIAGYHLPPLTTPEYRNYIRSFNEWIAESGARWLTKEMEGLVPKTVFESFQKKVLDGLRATYKMISELMGIKYTEGAFQKMLRDIYGKFPDTPNLTKLATVGRTRQDPNYKQLITREDGDFLKGAPSETALEKKTRLEAEKLPPAMQPLFKRLFGVNDTTVAGNFGRAATSISGAEKGESIGHAIIRNTVTSNLPFLERPLLRNLGKLLENVQNSTGRVMGLVEIGPLVYDPATKTISYKSGAGVESLAKIFEKIGTNKMNEARLVMLAQRVLALRAAGRLNSGGDVGIGVPMTNDEARQVIKAASPEVLEASRKFQKFNNDMVEFAIQTGLIPRSLGENFKSLLYTPMYRAQDAAVKADPNIGIGQSIYTAIKDPDSITAFNKAVGGDGQVDLDLYENILRNYNAIVSAGLKNIAYQETAATLTTMMRDGGDTTIAENIDKPANGAITYRVGGADRYMVIHDPQMFQAIASLSPTEKSDFVRAMGKVTAVLRKGITASPPFQLRNTIKGLVELKIKTGMPNVLLRTIASVSEVWNKEGAYKEILGHTGFGGFGFGSGYRNQAGFMKREMVAREKPLNAWNNFLRAFDKLEAIGEVTEMAPRIAYYKYLKGLKNKDGGRAFTDGDAAWEAINLVNYHRHGAGNGIAGSVISNLIPLTPFLTARIQGLYRLVETNTAGAPKSVFANAYAGIPVAIATRGMMVLLINSLVNAMYGDDDWYKRLTAKDKLSNMYVKVGDTVLALPRAYEVGELFGGLPTLMMDSIRKKDGSDIAMGTAAFMAHTFLFNPIPQFAKPIAEIIANRSFYTDQPVENLSDKRLPKEERADQYTSGLAKVLAQGSKAGADYVPLVGEALQASPKQIDALIRGYAGTMATLFLSTVDGLMSAGGTRPQGVFGDPASIGGIVGNATGLTSILKKEDQLTNRYVGDFYEIKDKVTQIVTSMTKAAERQDTETLKARIAESPNAKGIYTAFNHASEQLSKINHQEEIVRNSPSMTPDQKTKYLEQMQKAKATLAEQMVLAANKAGVYR